MKTILIILAICTALYAGVGAIKNTTSQMTGHIKQLNNATVAMRN